MVMELLETNSKNGQYNKEPVPRESFVSKMENVVKVGNGIKLACFAFEFF